MSTASVAQAHLERLGLENASLTGLRETAVFLESFNACYLLLSTLSSGAGSRLSRFPKMTR